MIPARARGGSAWFVAVLPGQWDRDRVRAMATAASMLPYDADQMLRRPTPHIVSFAAENAARTFHEALSRAGVTGVVYDQATVDEIPDARVARVVTVRAADEGDGPYRGGAGRMEVVHDGDVESALFLREGIRLAVVAKLATERVTEESELVTTFPQSSLRPPAAPQHVQRVHLEHDDQWVFDLYGATPAPVRIVERATELAGLGLRRFERRASMMQLRKWLDAGPFVIQEGYFPVGFHVGPTAPDLRRDDAVGWDTWSTHSWAIAKLRLGLGSAP